MYVSLCPVSILIKKNKNEEDGEMLKNKEYNFHLKCFIPLSILCTKSKDDKTEKTKNISMHLWVDQRNFNPLLPLPP